MKYQYLTPQEISPEHEHQLLSIMREHMSGVPGLEWGYTAAMVEFYQEKLHAFCAFEEDIIHGVYLLKQDAGKLKVKMLNQYFRPNLEQDIKIAMNKAVKENLLGVGIREIYLYSKHSAGALEKLFQDVSAGFEVKQEIQYCTWRLS